MGFLTPAAFALVALFPILIAMYLLKLRRTEQVVSSTYLWRRLLRDVEANAPWQRLRHNLLLILQLLFLAALILALVRPFTWTEGIRSQAVILIFDTSASMAATDVPPSRIQAAKAQARQLLANLPNVARITLISAGDGAQVLVASSQDRRQVGMAIDAIQAGAGASDLTAALELASALAARQIETEIVVFSDGRVQLPQRLSVTGQLRYVRIGQSDDNQAISLLSLEPAGAQGMTAFAQVTNYSDRQTQRRLALYADGQLVNAYDLEIAPGNQRAIVADDLPANTRVLEAQLGGSDALALDDRAWAVGRMAQPISVTLVTEGNLFLETALALLPNLDVTTVKPSELADVQPSISPADQPANPSVQLTIFDAYVPLTPTLSTGSLLFIAPPSSTDYFSITGRIEQPLLRPVQVQDPLLNYVNLAEVNVLDAVRITLPAWARPVIVGDAPPGAPVPTRQVQVEQATTSDNAPLLLVGETNGRRLAVLAFDLRRTDLPLQVAFPILLANLIGWLAPGGDSELPAQVDPGMGVTIPLPPGVESAVVTRPDGSTVQLIPEGRYAAFADTDQLGVYRVTWGQEDLAYFAVNLFSPQESDVRPVERLAVAGQGEAMQETRPQQARQEWWRPLAFAALALLSIEWLVYHRSMVTRLWGNMRQYLVRS